VKLQFRLVRDKHSRDFFLRATFFIPNHVDGNVLVDYRLNQTGCAHYIYNICIVYSVQLLASRYSKSCHEMAGQQERIIKCSGSMHQRSDDRSSRLIDMVAFL
jgi:hypothetical protein